MDRVMCYGGQQPTENDILNTNKNAMAGLGRLAWATVGGGPVFHGFGLTPSGSALTAVIGSGSAYLQLQTDATAYSSLGTDATNLVKQGIFVGGATLNFPAPGTTGQSINYLVQAAIADADSGSVVLPYFNSANPSVAFAGPGNSGTSQPIVRSTAVAVTVKAGTPATTGTQTTPAPDAGNIGLWVVTVAYGATGLSTSNIAAYSGTEFITHNIPTLQDLIKYVITSASLTVNPADITQLYAAIQNLSWTTGDAKLTLKTTADPGWILANDGTIGDASSGATYANVAAQALFTLLWNNVSAANAPMFNSTGGSVSRGGSAAADWAAHNRLSLTKALGRAIAVAGSGSGLTARNLGDTVGSENLQQHAHTINAAGSPAGIVTRSTTASAYNEAGGGNTMNVVTQTDDTGTGPNSGTDISPSPGGNMQPTSFWNVMIKL